MIISITTADGKIKSVDVDDEVIYEQKNLRAAKRVLMYAVLREEFPEQITEWPIRQARVIVNGEEPTEQDKKFMSRMEELKAELGL